MNKINIRVLGDITPIVIVKSKQMLYKNKAAFLKYAQLFLKSRGPKKNVVDTGVIVVSSRVSDLTGVGMEYLVINGEVIARFYNGRMSVSAPYVTNTLAEMQTQSCI